MKLLFLCSQNKRRSLTAEKIFDGYNGHEARSAGTESNARIKVTGGLLGWAEIIFCMEKKHLRRIREKYSDWKEVRIVNRRKTQPRSAIGQKSGRTGCGFFKIGCLYRQNSTFYARTIKAVGY